VPTLALRKHNERGSFFSVEGARCLEATSRFLQTRNIPGDYLYNVYSLFYLINDTHAAIPLSGPGESTMLR